MQQLETWENKHSSKCVSEKQRPSRLGEGATNMRPGSQLKASQQQQSELCKQLQGAETTLHTILLGCGWDYLYCLYPAKVWWIISKNKGLTREAGTCAPHFGPYFHEN
eukprot:1154568-Pelagomonas_calceolata.AAC.11